MQRLKPGKQPAEIFWIEGDFLAELDDGETIILAGSSAVDTSLSGTTGASIIVADSLMVGSGNHSLLVQLNGGTVGDKRKVSFRGKTSAGNLYELDVKVEIFD